MLTKMFFFLFSLSSKWISANIEIAHKRAEALQGIRNEVEKLEKSIVKSIKLKSIQYDCTWNVEHIRGCLKSLDRISKMHENDMKILEGRTIVFAQASGVSLEGHVMLFTGDVQHNWLDVCVLLKVAMFIFQLNFTKCSRWEPVYSQHIKTRCLLETDSGI